MAIQQITIPVDGNLRVKKYFDSISEEISSRKGKIRLRKERIETSDGQPYDRDDQIADLSNCVNQLLSIIEGLGGVISHPDIAKYQSRQALIQDIVDDYV